MDGQIVVVTGATGFVGSHVIKQLLEQGYTVRGTVRDAKDAKKCDFLQKLVVPAGTDPSRFTLFSADLTAPGSYDEVLRGATSLIHTAAVVKFTADDPQREIIDVTVNGVKNVISSLEKVLPDGKLKHVVTTSSIAAIQDLQRPEGHVYTEEDFNVSATVADDPYSVSKYQSEKIMTEWVKSQQDKGVDVTVAFINPGAIYGPIYSAAHILGSSTIIHDMMSGKFPAAPHLGFPSVDVRDVALAHIAALQKRATGRFVCVEKNLTMIEIATLARQSYPQYPFPTWRLPNALMYVAACFDKRISFAFLRHNLDKVRVFSSQRMADVLGVTPTRIAGTCIADSCKSFLDIGVITPKN